jgi:hypothetical protein
MRCQIIIEIKYAIEIITLIELENNIVRKTEL